MTVREACLLGLIVALLLGGFLGYHLSEHQKRLDNLDIMSGQFHQRLLKLEKGHGETKPEAN